MTYIIAEPCVNTTDTACVDVCPVDCIYLNDASNEKALQKAGLVSDPIMIDGKALNILLIHPSECIDCGACEPECPPAAIFAESETPAKWAEYIDYNYKAFGLSR